jgi:hypothetical protein
VVNFVIPSQLAAGFASGRMGVLSIYSRVAEQIAESHDGVLPVLHQVGHRTVSDILHISGPHTSHCMKQTRESEQRAHHLFPIVRHGASNLPLSIFIGDTLRVALLVNDSDRGI